MVDQTKSKFSKPMVIAISTVLVTLIFTTYKIINNNSVNQQNKNQLKNLTEEKISQSIAAIGRIEPKNKVIKLSGPSHLFNGRIIELLVEEGQQVKKGDVIAILDNLDKQKAVLEVAQQRVKIAQAKLEQVMTGDSKQGELVAQTEEITYLEAQFEGEIKTQEAKIARLKAELAQQQDIQTAEIESFKAELIHATTECQRYEGLLSEGAVDTSTRDSKCLLAQTFQEKLKETQANKNRVVETLQEQINEAQAGLDQILSTFPRQINQAQATLDTLVEVRSVDVQVAQAELSHAIASLTEAQADFDLSYVKAPIDGQVLKIHTFAGENIGSEGIIDLGQTQEMYVIAEVYESDIQKVKIGKTAKIFSSSLPIQFQGTVEHISLQVGKKDVFNSDPTLDIDARVFEVKIRLDPSDNEEASGLINVQVEVEINFNN